MVGADHAVCVYWRIMGYGYFAGVCGAKVEVLRIRREKVLVFTWCEGSVGVDGRFQWAHTPSFTAN